MGPERIPKKGIVSSLNKLARYTVDGVLGHMHNGVSLVKDGVDKSTAGLDGVLDIGLGGVANEGLTVVTSLMTLWAHPATMYEVARIVVSLMGVLDSPMWFLASFAGIFWHPDMKIILRSIRMNANRLLVTSAAAVCLVLAFSIRSYIMQHNRSHDLDIFGDELDADNATSSASSPTGARPIAKARVTYLCNTLLSCFVTHLQHAVYALPLSDLETPVLPESWSDVSDLLTVLWQMGFFLSVVIIFIAVLSGSITDTFGQLRGEDDDTDRKIAECCAVCGMHRSKFDELSVDFTQHTAREHKLLDYFYFVLMIRKAQNDETLHAHSDIVKSVAKRIDMNDIRFWPRDRALALSAASATQQAHDAKDRENQGSQGQVMGRLDEMHDMLERQDAALALQARRRLLPLAR